MAEHLSKMRAALETRPKGDRPTLERITEALGAFSSAVDGTEEGYETPKRRSRRRPS